MVMQWTDDLSVGVEQIDAQHRELIANVNNLMAACREGKGKQAVGDIIDFLGDYVVRHFSAEEKYMLDHNYPYYSSHKGQHENFIKDFTSLKARFDTEGPGIHIVILTNSTVVDWLIKHIKNTDKALGVFLKQRL